MPNWCDNYITLTHKNKRKAKAFAGRCQKESRSEKYKYFHRIAGERAFVQNCEYDGANTLTLCVDSAWSPCEDTIRTLESRKYGFELVSGTYYEGGAGICGYLLGDEFDSSDFDNIPKDIVQTHGIEPLEDESE